jgi:predicted Fe-Mo cluster-binding NifX family protein
MKIVFTSKGSTWDSIMDPRFGRTDYLIQYDEENDKLELLDNKDSENHAHGVGPKTVQKLFDFGADILITGNGPGGNAAMVLKNSGIKTYIGAGDLTVKEAYEYFKKGQLKEFEY